MIVKTHTTPNGKILVTAIDTSILGKHYEEDNKQLNLTSNFYKGEEKTTEETSDLLRNADMINIAGEKTVQLAIKEELIEPQHIKTIQGIPHAQAILTGGE